MKMYGGILAFIEHRQLFCRRFWIAGVLDAAIADHHEDKFPFRKDALPIIGNIPAWHIIPDIVKFMPVGFPIFDRKLR